MFKNSFIVSADQLYLLFPMMGIIVEILSLQLNSLSLDCGQLSAVNLLIPLTIVKFVFLSMCPVQVH